MRSLLISILSLSIILLSWIAFYHYSDGELQSMIHQCDYAVMRAVEEEDWDEAYDTFRIQYDNWHSYRAKALYFLDTETVNQADSSFARTLMYIKAKDLSNSSGELLSLREQLKFLLENEKPSPENIL